MSYLCTFGARKDVRHTGTYTCNACNVCERHNSTTNNDLQSAYRENSSQVLHSNNKSEDVRASSL
jgi:hypothetical protein